MRFGGLIAAIIFAAIAAVVVLRMSNSEAPAPTTQSAAPAEVKTVNIYVAAKPIAIGSTLTEDMIAIQPWPEHLVLPGFILADAKGSQSLASKALDGGKVAPAGSIVGNVARAPFQQQEPIIRSKLANPNDPNFLAGELPKGMRVITIITNETEGLAGFVFPGDHVDVILTHDVDKPKADGSVDKNSVSETLLNNVTVLAVDQRASGAEATDKDGKLTIPRSVSLMVSPTDAQRIRLGEKIGVLTLSLRALADKESADPMTITEQRDISQYKNSGGGGDIIIYRGVKKDTPDTNNNAAAAPGAGPVANPNLPSGRP